MLNDDMIDMATNIDGALKQMGNLSQTAMLQKRLRYLDEQYTQYKAGFPLCQ